LEFGIKQKRPEAGMLVGVIVFFLDPYVIAKQSENLVKNWMIYPFDKTVPDLT